MKTQTLDQVKGLGRLTNNAKSVILRAYDIARYENSDQRGKASKIKVEHLLASILIDKKAVAHKVAQRVGLNVDELLRSIMKIRSPIPRGVIPSEEFNDVIVGAFFEASSLGHVYVGSEHLLLSLFKHKEFQIVKNLAKKGVNYEVLKSALISIGNYHPGIFSSLPDDASQSKGALEYFTSNMNELARQGRYLPIFGREDEIERLIHILSRKNKNNPVLIGEAGVGKTAIVEGFVQKIIAGEVPDALSDYEVIQLDLAVILAGAKIRGDVEERLMAIIDELERDKNKVVFIDEIHMIVGAGTAGGSGGMDIANLLKPHLTSGSIKVIGATTFNEYQKYFEDDSALNRRFQPITIDEISEEDAENLLQHVKGEYEKYHEIKIGNDAVGAAVKFSSRYIADRYLPDKALDVIDETAAKKKLSQRSVLQSSILSKKLEKIRKSKNEALSQGNINAASQKRQEERELLDKLKSERKRLSDKRKSQKVNEEDVRTVVSKMTGIPVTTMARSDIESLKMLEKTFAKRVYGQAKALSRVASSIKRSRVGLVEPNRPLASFLFLGPTGVGKTETAKVVAEYLFGDEKSIIQVDMSEFMEQYSVSKIIGSPPGYVGFAEGGQITEKVRRKPYSVVLFDEIEKAHPDALNILLQVLDEGHLRDGKGRDVNFRNTIIVMTSNIGAEVIAEDAVLGFDVSSDGKDTKNKAKAEEEAYDEMRKRLMVELKSSMRPEFLNRIDDIVIFRGLDKSDAKQITKYLLGKLEERLKEFNTKIKYSSKVINLIVEEGFSEEYGARNLRRKIQELIESKLSDMILEGKIDVKDRVSTVKIERDGKKLVFEVVGK